MAPEIHRHEPYVGKQIDIFAAGVMLYIFCTGLHPFQKAAVTDKRWKGLFAKGKIKDVMIDTKTRAKINLPTTFFHLVAFMLHPIAEKRATMKDIKESPWYNKEVATLEQVQENMNERQILVNEHRNKEHKTYLDEKKQSRLLNIQKVEEERGMQFDKDLWTQIDKEIVKLDENSRNSMKMEEITEQMSNLQISKVSSYKMVNELSFHEVKKGEKVNFNLAHISEQDLSEHKSSEKVTSWYSMAGIRELLTNITYSTKKLGLCAKVLVIDNN